uniref:Protein kinase domain-containing protein n=1 Tax=Kalanchoe fedtschenkoi TaxID=63787 RepID=A0A7N0VAU7_KALFE
MLARAFAKPQKRKNSQCGSNNAYSNGELYYHDDYSMAEWYMDEQSLVFCDKARHDEECGTVFGSHPTLRDVLRSAVAVLGESCMGMTEKVVLVQGRIYAMKRFKTVGISKGRFGKRVERLAQVGRGSPYLAPVVAYLYSKRVKVVMQEHFPMGSLADLLAEGREGCTTLDWPQRLAIIIHVALAISFIHNQHRPRIRSMQMNVHGNIKASNVMIRDDFSACLSDYGFTQLAIPDCLQQINSPNPNYHAKMPSPPKDHPTYVTKCNHTEKASQKKDVYDFGALVLDMLGGPRAPGMVHCIRTNKEGIENGKLEFFEFATNVKERNEALVVLDTALACVDELAAERPSMNRILSLDVFRKYTACLHQSTLYSAHN